jgi:hypothetical protein
LKNRIEIIVASGYVRLDLSVVYISEKNLEYFTRRKCASSAGLKNLSTYYFTSQNKSVLYEEKRQSVRSCAAKAGLSQPPARLDTKRVKI